MNLRHITFRDACAFVKKHHRHHTPPRGHIVSVACDLDGVLIGVAMIGRPVSRHLQDGHTLEVTRLCVSAGNPNAASWLLTRAKRVIHALGAKAITYTLESEGGASLRAAGWNQDKTTSGGSWSRPSRTRTDPNPTCRKVRWSA